MPAAVGFGIGTPAQAADVGRIADGVIIGSRLVRLAREEGTDGVAAFLKGDPRRSFQGPERVGSPAMKIVVALFLALAANVISYALGQGGPVGALIFLTVLFTGAALHYAQPLLDKLKP